MDTELSYFNLSNEEGHAIRTFADDTSTVIKKADKGLSVVFWDHIDYIKGAEKQLSKPMFRGTSRFIESYYRN